MKRLKMRIRKSALQLTLNGASVVAMRQLGVAYKLLIDKSNHTMKYKLLKGKKKKRRENKNLEDLYRLARYKDVQGG